MDNRKTSKKNVQSSTQKDLKYRNKSERLQKIGKKYIDIAMKDVERDLQKMLEKK